MEKKPNTLNSLHQTHFVDIHEEVLSEGDEEKMIKEEEKVEKHLNRPTKAKRGHRINRQVSLETGFSVLNKENKGKNDRKVLTRSGTSLGVLGSDNKNIGLEGHKRDFSIFKTKSSLSKQNSLLPRKEKELLESQKINGSAVDDESVHASDVPVGRYFAALRGPELDEVKVSDIFYFKLHACVLASWVMRSGFL